MKGGGEKETSGHVPKNGTSPCAIKFGTFAKLHLAKCTQVATVHYNEQTDKQF